MQMNQTMKMSVSKAQTARWSSWKRLFIIQVLDNVSFWARDRRGENRSKRFAGVGQLESKEVIVCAQRLGLLQKKSNLCFLGVEGSKFVICVDLIEKLILFALSN